ncbi:MAG: hypothetical protein RUMPE_00053 [Eubacteriales bacterium SKADARSKE-1]|nr:hypothetical protein [Eubacteriales bacterium SKADARSKE-1]
MRKLCSEDMELVLGGYICRDQDGEYVLFGMDDNGGDRLLEMGNNFFKAAKWDWKLFKKQYQAMGIATLQELEQYYNYGNFTLRIKSS